MTFDRHSAETTLVDRLRRRADTQPDRIAMKFVTPTPDERFATESLTYADIDRWARTIAVSLLDRCRPGDRVVMLCSPDIEYYLYFCGCLYAGLTPVPAYPLSSHRHRDRLESIAESSIAQAVLIADDADTAAATGIDNTTTPALDALTRIGVDRHTTTGRHDEWRRPPITPGTTALIQYTSGSTAEPKGVVVSHRNLLANSRLAGDTFRMNGDSVLVTWLPPFHDMGLLTGLVIPIDLSTTTVVMTPLSFVREPTYWLEVISRERATHSVGPNFAYQMCLDIAKQDLEATLDLSGWTHAMNGSEAIRAHTLDDFATRFAECGFRRSAFYPCYGLAEATLLVSGARAGDEPRTLDVSSAQLERGVIDTDNDGSARTKIVGSGTIVAETQVLIVDPMTKQPLPEGGVGEVWIRGICVTAGYFDNPEATRETFDAYTGEGDGPFLNPGDLGCMIDGELFIVGRTKEVMNFRGRKLHPHDIEECVAGSHSALHDTRSIAFSADIDDEERLVIVQQRPRCVEGTDADKKLVSTIRRAVMDQHRVLPHDIVLVPHRAIPKTSSGKLQRAECRRRYLAGELTDRG